MFYLTKTPLLLKWALPLLVWKKPNVENRVFLTFDDGPTKEYTEQILTLLKEHNIKATFFCVGANVEKHPTLYQSIINQEHSVGNHTMNHLNGWKTSSKKYLSNIDEATRYIKSSLFRPPYGKINFSSIKKINAHYDIIMWDIVGGDFDSKCGVDKIVNNVLNNIKSGSIVVLHDNKNFSEKTIAALPKIIDGVKKMGLSFSKL